MRPILVLWFVRHGLPAVLVPDYFTLVGVSATGAMYLALREARREGADMAREARLLALIYVAALLGGYVFEWLRVLPQAIALRSAGPVLRAGRAAYGGLLGAMLAALCYLHRSRMPVGPFFDRIALGAGVIFACVRTGCFLAGCDYGAPTGSALGVRFPAGSLAALDHARRGLVAAGAPSLPVHPTQLYEALLGLAAAGVACWVRRRPGPAGGAFLCWLGLYALGRYCIEFLRGDASRGVYLGLSTAQYVSLGLLTLTVGLWERGRCFQSRPLPKALDR